MPTTTTTTTDQQVTDVCPFCDEPMEPGAVCRNCRPGEQVETEAGRWQAPGWAEHADYYPGEIEHVLLVEHPDDAAVIVMLCQDDDLVRDDDGRVRAVRRPVSVVVEAPADLGPHNRHRWDEFTIGQARALSIADLPGLHADAWPMVQQVVADVLAAYDAAVTAWADRVRLLALARLDAAGLGLADAGITGTRARQLADGRGRGVTVTELIAVCGVLGVNISDLLAAAEGKVPA